MRPRPYQPARRHGHHDRGMVNSELTAAEMRAAPVNTLLIILNGRKKSSIPRANEIAIVRVLASASLTLNFHKGGTKCLPGTCVSALFSFYS
jgi:hypothetical protein